MLDHKMDKFIRRLVNFSSILSSLIVLKVGWVHLGVCLGVSACLQVNCNYGRNDPEGFFVHMSDA